MGQPDSDSIFSILNSHVLEPQHYNYINKNYQRKKNKDNYVYTHNKIVAFYFCIIFIL